MNIRLIRNEKGGVDARVEGTENLDNRNPQRIALNTGSKEDSLLYWKAMKESAEIAIRRIELPAIHVVIVNSKGYGRRIG